MPIGPFNPLSCGGFEDPSIAVLAAAPRAADLRPMTFTDDYVLGRSAEEYERLRGQARMWEPETTRLLDRVGPPLDGYCLDVGCGPGETMRVMAERVGPGGRVTGIDVDAALGAQAIAALHAAGHRQCMFEVADIERDDEEISGAPFDLVFARLLLIHVHEPAVVLRRLWDLVAPGGYLVLQEYDLRTAHVVPELETIEEFVSLTRETFRRSGRDIDLGLGLAALHVEAGVGAPDGVDAGVRLGPFAELAPMHEAVYRSLLPTALSLGVTTEADSERWLERFARDREHGDGHTALWSLLVGSWKRKAVR
jgi:SAM-dependent methyltransferase